MADPEKRRRMGLAGRQRAVDRFSWASIAKRTKTLYDSLVQPLS
jgi:starch synthase